MTGRGERAVQAENTVRFVEPDALALEQQRGTGPRTDETRERLGQVESERIRRARQWQREQHWPTDLGLFEREILPNWGCVDWRTRHADRAVGGLLPADQAGVGGAAPDVVEEAFARCSPARARREIQQRPGVVLAPPFTGARYSWGGTLRA